MAKQKIKKAKRLISKDKGEFTDKNAAKIRKKTNLKIGKIFKLNAKDDAKKDAALEGKRGSKYNGYTKGDKNEDPDINIRDPFDFRKNMANKGEYREAIEEIDEKYADNPYLKKYKGPQELKKSAKQRTKDFKFNTKGAGSQLNKKGELVRDSSGNKFKEAEAPEFESGYDYKKLGKKFDSLRSNMGLDKKSEQPGMKRIGKSISNFSDKYKKKSNALKIPDRGGNKLNQSGKNIIGKIGL